MLVAICLICSALLAVLNDITAPIIEESHKGGNAGRLCLCPAGGHPSDSMTEVENLTTDGVKGAVKTANGDVAVKAAAPGYSGSDVTVYVAFDAEGAVSNISIDGSTQTHWHRLQVADSPRLYRWNGGESPRQPWMGLSCATYSSNAQCSTPSTRLSTATTMRSRGCSKDERKTEQVEGFYRGHHP